ncbi:mechanosensitive ion channel domain-containing protein [Botrimarina hoheduenensis]|uniref:Mechanosensitive channel MscK n=1 Tax=Botrimarina hoheduenensis TaxID=2528000 RepID=A0A5C5VS04_9BACT|nr:mechanosensitive ion channel domain-containing protein [Botrimarina hoheduenensis]TWT41416.1 Mechanosensitive channel MscK precursor [Botrimarina hoheduenensis]
MKFLALALTFAFSPLALAESPAADTVAETSDVSAPAPRSEAGADEAIASLKDQVKSLQEEIGKAEGLAEEPRRAALALCDKASDCLADEIKLANLAAKLRAEMEGSQPVPTEVPKDIPAAAEVSLVGLDLETIRVRISQAAEQHNVLVAKADELNREITRRNERRQRLPALQSECRETLSKTELLLAESADPSAPALVQRARRLWLQARFAAKKQEIQTLDQETRTYEAGVRLWLERSDKAQSAVETSAASLRTLETHAAQFQQKEAERQARVAKWAAASAHPAIHSAAAENAELAERNTALVADIEASRLMIEEATSLRETLQHRLDDVQKRSEASAGSQQIGQLLRTLREQMPDLAGYRHRLRERPLRISKLGIERYDWENQRHLSRNIEEAVKQELAGMETDADVVSAMRGVMLARRELLTQAIGNGANLATRLEELDAAETGLMSVAQTLDAFIAEKVLWVRSAAPIGLSDGMRVAQLPRQMDSLGKVSAGIFTRLTDDLRSAPALWMLLVLTLIGFLITRRRVRRRLLECGEAASRVGSTEFRPTLVASLATLVMAAPLPLAIAFLGWRMHHVAAGSGLFTWIAWPLVLVAGAYAMLNTVRHACRVGGLGDRHFGWDSNALRQLSRGCRRLQLLATPLLATAIGIELTGQAELISGPGRFALMSALLVIAGVSWTVLRPRGAVVLSIVTGVEHPFAAALARCAGTVSLLMITGIFVATTAGYHYTAMQLTRLSLISIVVVFGCLALHAMLTRWLLVSYRRAAMRRAQERRRALADAQEQGSDTPVIETTPQVSLSDINRQARRLVGMAAALAFLGAMGIVWSDVLPALGVISRVQLWSIAGAAGAPAEWITLADALWAGLALFLTWYAGKNLPGLLEIAVLQRLPIDAGARYAVSSLTGYAIMVVGAMVGCRYLGVGWTSVQWLVAAMSVGLGFGLQEIFANFVSGLILLFERPARVGDTVTIGAITGTVTKIRIRATTILDWDNKELIVPNKEFVVGNLVNWTLSNPNLRLVLTVGVAYGSDTKLATELLYRVARENPNVIAEPEPVVVFTEFGDSALTFELRVFVRELAMFRRLRHELNMSIDSLFREHRIEIAFPQCDLHVRSLPAALDGIWNQGKERVSLSDAA